MSERQWYELLDKITPSLRDARLFHKSKQDLEMVEGGRRKGSSCVQNKVVGLQSKKKRKKKDNFFKNPLRQINNVQLRSW